MRDKGIGRNMVRKRERERERERERDMLRMRERRTEYSMAMTPTWPACATTNPPVAACSELTEKQAYTVRMKTKT